MSIHTVEINTPDSFAVVEIRQGPAGEGGGGSAMWGAITGTLSDQTDLQSALDGKAPSSGIAPSAITGTAVITTDPRLSDARTPTAHTHVVSDITPVSGQHLIGRHAGGSGAAQEVTVGNGLEFQGSGIRRSALTGDVAASAGSNSTTIANDAVSNTKLANMAQATIKGRAFGAGTGDPQDLTATEARTAIGAAATVHTHVSADITDATSAATPSTLVLRDGSGGASLSGLTTSGPVSLHKGGSSDLFSFDFLNVYFGPGSALEFRTKLQSGATGDALFTATSAAEARETLGVRTFRTTADVSNASQTPANGNVPELTFPVVAGKSYKIDFCFILAAAGGSLVHQIKATYPTASLPSLGDCLGLHRFTVKAPTPGATSLDFNTSTAAAAASGVHSGYWFYRPSASGDVTFQIYNYDATAVTSTLKAGTTVTPTEL